MFLYQTEPMVYTCFILIISCFTGLFGNYTKYYEWQEIEFMITTHKNCKTEVVSGSGPHFASLRCVDHNKWITWLSPERAKELDPNFVPGIRNNFEELFNQ